jgi:hypothetical protein
MNQIKNFEDVKLERTRLELLAVAHRAELRNEIASLKDQFKPFSILAGWLGGFQNQMNKNPLAVAGASAGIDLLVRDKLLSKSNWIVRSLVPLVLKNVVSFFGKKKE